MMLRAPRMPWHEALFWLSVSIYVAVLPMSSTIALRNVAFAGMIAATLWALAKRRLTLRFPAGAAWALYAAVALLSLAWAIDAGYSFGQIRSEIGYGAIVFVIAASWIDDIERLRRLAWIAVACDIFMATYSIYLVATTPDAESALIGSYRAATGTYSTYLITVAPLLLFLIWDVHRDRRTEATTALVALIAANLVALWFTANRQGFAVYAAELALVGAFSLRIAFGRRKLALVIATVTIIAMLFVAQHFKRSGAGTAEVSPKPDSSQQLTTLHGDPRWQLWRFTVGEIAKQPWHGAGFGREVFLKVHGDYRRRTNLSLLWHAHNMVLNKGIQMGVPGILAFLALWVALAAALRREAARGGDVAVAACAAALLVGVFLKNMTDDFFVQDNALMFWLYFGALLASLRQPDATRER